MLPGTSFIKIICFRSCFYPPKATKEALIGRRLITDANRAQFEEYRLLKVLFKSRSSQKGRTDKFMKSLDRKIDRLEDPNLLLEINTDTDVTEGESTFFNTMQLEYCTEDQKGDYNY